ncbi:MAG: TonB-dependent receptor [Woeseiaceae bacterium]|nr:TonB-dependent receptor [Woeseiaceae bacterium]
MKTFRIVCGGILAALVFATTAANAADDVIVVTATRSERALQDVIVPMTVIGREQIERSGAADLAELLRFEAGLDIGRNGGPGQATSVFLRGTESNHTLVLIDGVRINPGTIGGAAIQNVAPETIERVEIVKGARSALYGTDAIGGVVNIITRRAGDGYAEAGGGGGSFGTQSAYASTGVSGDGHEFGATVNWQTTDGYAIRTDSPLERGYDNLSANLYGSMDMGAATVSLRHWRASGKTEYLDFFQAPLSQDFRNESTSAELVNPLGDDGQSRLLVSYMVDDIEQNDSPDFVTSERLALDWQVSATLASHALSAGLYATRENADSLSFGSGFDERTDTQAVFLQDSMTWERQRAFVAARYTDHESFDGEFTWNAEYALDLTESWSLNAGIGHAFRAPDATDRYGFGGNPDLRPEVSDELQVGTRYDLTDRHTLRLEAYRNDIDDLIEFDAVDFMLRNLRRAEIRGAQLGWDFRGEVYTVRADVLVQSAEDAVTGASLLRRPEQSATLNVSRSLGEHALGLSLLAGGEREDIGGSLPGYVLLNLTGQFRLGQHWQLNARIENALDTDYQTAVPYRMAGRSAYLDLKYRW